MFIDANIGESLIFRGMVLLPVTICGILINGLASYIMYSHKAFENPFGRIQGLQAACDSSSSALVLTWTIINMIYKDEAIRFQTLNEKIGQYALGFFQCSVTATFLLASSRFIAITFPMIYRTRRMMHITHVALIITIILNICYTILYFFPGCAFSADEKLLVYFFAKTPCGDLISFYIDYVASVSIHGVAAIINLATYISLRSINKKPEDLSDMQVFLRRRKREYKFYIQTVVHLALIVSLQTIFHVMDYIESSGFPLFLGTTYVWMLVNFLQGCVVFFMNPEVINRCRRMLCERDIHPIGSTLATTIVKF